MAGARAKYKAVRATEEELDAFMAEHEELLAEADKFEPLRNAGEAVMEAFNDEPDRLYGELLRLCRQVVQAMYANEGGVQEKFDPEMVDDCHPLSLIALDAIDRAESHKTLVAACSVGEHLDAEAEDRLREHAVTNLQPSVLPSAPIPAVGNGVRTVHVAATERRHRSTRLPGSQPGFFGRLLSSLFGGDGSSGPSRTRPARNREFQGAPAGSTPLKNKKPSMELMEQLCGLGFSLSNVEAALIDGNNDAGKALELLTSQDAQREREKKVTLVDMELAKQLCGMGFATHTVYMALHEAKNDAARALEILTGDHRGSQNAASCGSGGCGGGASGDDEEYELVEAP